MGGEALTAAIALAELDAPTWPGSWIGVDQIRNVARPPVAVARDVEQAAIELGSDGFAAFFAELLALIRSGAAAGPLPPITVPEPTNDIETAVCAHFDRLEQRLPYRRIDFCARCSFIRARHF